MADYVAYVNDLNDIISDNFLLMNIKLIILIKI